MPLGWVNLKKMADLYWRYNWLIIGGRPVIGYAQAQPRS